MVYKIKSKNLDNIRTSDRVISNEGKLTKTSCKRLKRKTTMPLSFLLKEIK